MNIVVQTLTSEQDIENLLVSPVKEQDTENLLVSPVKEQELYRKMSMVIKCAAFTICVGQSLNSHMNQ